jgi:hypothetical protein
LEARLVRDLDGLNKPSTIHQFRPVWMKDPAHAERIRKGNITRASKKNSDEKAKEDSDRQKALESLIKVEEELPEPEEEEQDGDVHASYTCFLKVTVSFFNPPLSRC